MSSGGGERPWCPARDEDEPLTRLAFREGVVLGGASVLRESGEEEEDGLVASGVETERDCGLVSEDDLDDREEDADDEALLFRTAFPPAAPPLSLPVTSAPCFFSPAVLLDGDPHEKSPPPHVDMKLPVLSFDGLFFPEAVFAVLAGGLVAEGDLDCNHREEEEEEDEFGAGLGAAGGEAVWETCWVTLIVEGAEEEEGSVEAPVDDNTNTG